MEMKAVITAGFLVAGQMRRLLMKLDIPFKEDKGFPEHYFFVSKEDAKVVAKYVPND